jgi:small-conductance mechanosensitive channel
VPNFTLSTLTALALPVGFAVAGLLLGLAVQRTVLTRLARAAARTRLTADDIVVAALRGPVVLWCSMLGLYLAAEVAELPRPVAQAIQRLLVVMIMVSVTWALARAAGNVIAARARAENAGLPSVNLVTNLAKAIVLGLGALVILQTLGISITPLLTALGVGGLAVGLALQDTLANLFAGIHILLSRQVRPGDFIRLSSGQEGYIQDVTWRYTTIRQLANNLTIVPNTQLASAVTANFSLPDPEQAVALDVGVSYDSDLGKVEAVTVEVGREVMQQVEGGVRDFTPSIRYHTFGDSAIQFTVNLRGREYVSQYLIKHEFIKRLHRRYREEGIAIPYPIRTVRLQDGAAASRPRPADL